MLSISKVLTSWATAYRYIQPAFSTASNFSFLTASYFHVFQWFSLKICDRLFQMHVSIAQSFLYELTSNWWIFPFLLSPECLNEFPAIDMIFSLFCRFFRVTSASYLFSVNPVSKSKTELYTSHIVNLKFTTIEYEKNITRNKENKHNMWSKYQWVLQTFTKKIQHSM